MARAGEDVWRGATAWTQKVDRLCAVHGAIDAGAANSGVARGLDIRPWSAPLWRLAITGTTDSHTKVAQVRAAGARLGGLPRPGLR